VQGTAPKSAQNFVAGDEVKYVGNNPTPYAESGDAGTVDNDYTPNTAGDNVPVKWNGGGFDIVSKEGIEKTSVKAITARNPWGEDDSGTLVNIAVNALSGAGLAIDSQLSSTIRNAIEACISRNKRRWK